MLAASQSSKIFYFEVSSNDSSTASEIVAAIQSPTTVACKNMNEFSVMLTKVINMSCHSFGSFLRRFFRFFKRHNLFIIIQCEKNKSMMQEVCKEEIRYDVSDLLLCLCLSCHGGGSFLRILYHSRQSPWLKTKKKKCLQTHCGKTQN